VKRYTYKFSWTGTDGKLQTKYLDNRSMVEAEEDFQKTFGEETKGLQVSVRRLAGK
jgi:hypothetical protein